MIVRKSADEIALIREAGCVLAEAQRLAQSLIQPGISTQQIDTAVEAVLAGSGAVPLFKGFPGPVPFPAATCISLNEEVAHGIPGPRRLTEGDLITVDVGCRLNGWCADCAWTYPVGQVEEGHRKLLEAGRTALAGAISELGGRRRWTDVASIIRTAVEAEGFRIVEDVPGHGIGRELHEDPQVHFRDPGDDSGFDFPLETGTVLAVEPILSAGSHRVRTADDGWTLITIDRQVAVHFEHTVALTQDGALVLTANPSD